MEDVNYGWNVIVVLATVFVFYFGTIRRSREQRARRTTDHSVETPLYHPQTVTHIIPLLIVVELDWFRSAESYHDLWRLIVFDWIRRGGFDSCAMTVRR